MLQTLGPITIKEITIQDILYWDCLVCDEVLVSLKEAKKIIHETNSKRSAE